MPFIAPSSISPLHRQDLVPVTPNIFSQELECYSLPYGALGFTSHVLTYYTLVCLWKCRKPLWPFQKTKPSRRDLVLGFVGLITTFIMTVITLVRCRNTWQLLVIGVWKMGMSLLSGFTALHVAFVAILHPEDAGKRAEKSVWWITIYILSMFAGISGLMNIVLANMHHRGVEILTKVFFSFISLGIFVILCSIPRVCCNSDTAGEAMSVAAWIGGLLIYTTVFSALYSDWALGMIANNIVGVPSKDVSKFYYTYYAAKRLTMFTSIFS